MILLGMMKERLLRHGSRRIDDMLGSMDDNVQVTLHQKERISLIATRHLEEMLVRGEEMQKLLEILSGLHQRNEQLLFLHQEDERAVMDM
jgi:hypothetical protein